jgi:6-phosphogluconolactonase
MPQLSVQLVTCRHSSRAVFRRGQHQEGASVPSSNSEALRVYIGTYTPDQGSSGGIWTCCFDPRSGELSAPVLAAVSSNPSFLALHPSGAWLYAVNEASQADGTVSAFAIDRQSGQLGQLNMQDSHGIAPCFISLDSAGLWALVANYGGSVAVLPILPSGLLGPASDVVKHTGSGSNPERQAGPHPHSIQFDPSGRFVAVPDLGSDRIAVYALDAGDGRLTGLPAAAAQLAAGAGPRQLVFSADGRFAWVANELTSTVTSLRFDPVNGGFTVLDSVSTLPAGFGGTNHPAEIQLHPSGHFVFVSNRGHDSIAVFRVDAATGGLTLTSFEATRGRTPRNFTLDPSGAFLLVANQHSGSVVVFSVDPEDGSLTPAGHSVEVALPVCVKLLA